MGGAFDGQPAVTRVSLQRAPFRIFNGAKNDERFTGGRPRTVRHGTKVCPRRDLPLSRESWCRNFDNYHGCFVLFITIDLLLHPLATERIGRCGAKKKPQMN